MDAGRSRGTGRPSALFESKGVAERMPLRHVRQSQCPTSVLAGGRLPRQHRRAPRQEGKLKSDGARAPVRPNRAARSRASNTDSSRSSCLHCRRNHNPPRPPAVGHHNASAPNRHRSCALQPCLRWVRGPILRCSMNPWRTRHRQTARWKPREVVRGLWPGCVSPVSSAPMR